MPEIRENAKPAPAWPHFANEEERDRRRTAIGGPTCGHTRRAAVRLLSVCALATPAVLRSQTARAIKGWCRRDPIVKIGDLTVDIVLSSYTDMNVQATGPTQLVITVPPGIPTRFVADDPGFGRHGYDVRFVESHELIADHRSFDVQVKVYTPAANLPEGPLPILLKVTPLGDGLPASNETEGLANEWVMLHATLAADDSAAPSPSPADESDDTPPTDARDKKAREKGKKGRGKKNSR